MSRSRTWCFTINNYNDSDIDNLLSMTFRYLVFGFEEGQKKTPHIQGYVYFYDAKTVSSVNKKIPRAHLEQSKGSYEQNYNYCTKEGDYYEIGDPPDQGKLNMEKIINIINNPYENFQLYNQYHRTYEQLKKKERISSYQPASVIVAPHQDRYGIFKTYSSVSTDYDTYDGEELLMFGQYPPWEMIEDLIHGINPKLKRGYEIVALTPEVILLTYDTPADFINLNLKLKSLNIKPDMIYK